MKRIFLLLWIMTTSSISHAKEEYHVTFNANSTLPEASAQHHLHSRVRRRINPATCQQTCFSVFYFQTFFLRRRGFSARSRLSLLAAVNLNNCRRRCLTPVLGTTADNPAVSCAAILSANPSAQSGQYFLRSANAGPSDPSTSVFCDMTLDCDGVVGGWRQIADIDAEIGCPEDFSRIVVSFIQPPFIFCLPRSAVGPAAGCLVSLSFPVNSIEYSQVCGRITGSYSSTENFDLTGFGSLIGGTGTLDGLYVDGISLTYGSSPRTHIWTFAATNAANDPSNNICPCVSASAPQPPGFVGRNYFCDSTSTPVWDGNECSGSDMCSCTDGGGNGPPFFLRTFDTPVAEDIEMRLCTDNAGDTVDLILVELYVR